MTRWWARWRVALRIARRDAARHKGRTALVVAMVALPLLAGTAGLVLVRSAMGTPETEVARVLGPSGQALVHDSGCGPIHQSPDTMWISCLEGDGDSTPLDAASLQDVLGNDRSIPLNGVSVTLRSDDAAVVDQGLTEVDDAADLAEFVDLGAGRLPTAPGEIALTPSLEQRLGIEVGDSITLDHDGDSVDVSVVGTLDRSTQYAVVALTGTTPPEWSADSPGLQWMVLGDPVTWDDVMAANAQGWQVWSRDVILDPPPADEVPEQELFSSGDGTALQTVGIVGAVLAMGLIELGLLVGPAFAIGAKRSGRQLAVTAAAGGAPADLRRSVLGAGVVTGVAATVVGIGLGLALGAAAYGVILLVTGYGLPALVLPTWELVVVAIVAILLGVGAAWMPARSAAKSDVVAALAGRRAEPRPTRGVARLGVALAVLGLLGMLLGAVSSTPAGLVAGIVALEIGVVMLSGTIVVLVGRLAPRLGAGGRFALRDAVRHRSRTAPAVAAVLAAVAAAAAGAIYLQGESTASRASWLELSASPGLVLQWSGEELTDSERAVTEALARIEAEIDVEAAVPVHAAWAAPDGSEPDAAPTMGGVHDVSVYGLTDPDLTCPDGSESADPRCSTGHGLHHPTTSLSLPGTLIDDGTYMTAAGLEGWEQAAETLADGGVVVEQWAVWADGSAHLVGRAPGLSEDPAQAVVVLPAYGSTWMIPTFGTVLSPQAAEQIGVTPVVVGGLVTTAAELDQGEVDRLNGIVRDVSPYLTLTADRPRPEGVPIGLVLLGVACAVALAAVGLAVGLAGADTGPDMATLAAVGAPPKIRRRVAAAQAGVIAGTGAVLGVLTGVPIGLVMSLWGREQSGYGDLWPLSVPWPVPVMAIAIPLVAMGFAWLFTRSRLPLVRRVAE